MNKDNIIDYIQIGMTIIFCIIGLSLLIELHHQRQSCEIIKDTFQVKSDDFDIHGYYNRGEDYYCVLTNTDDLDLINETDYHERCHAFVEDDYDHFCSVGGIE
jgi:predicted ATPase